MSLSITFGAKMSHKSAKQKTGRWTFGQLEEAVRKILPDARLWEDHDGEICVATRLQFPEKRWTASKGASFDWQHSELHAFTED